MSMASLHCSWPTSPSLPVLSRHEVHVWCIPLQWRQQEIQNLAEILTEDERERANRFRLEQIRNHFIVARGVLRIILGCYLQVEPSNLRFKYGPYGKPALDGQALSGELCFNLSHCAGIALYAFTWSRAVGIDVESLCPGGIDWGIADRFFSRREVAALRALPEDQRDEGFFNCWTRKEAYIKARGEGFSIPLDSFDVSLIPGEPASLLATREDPTGAAQWSLRHLEPCTGCVGALTVKGHARPLRLWSLPAASPVFEPCYSPWKTPRLSNSHHSLHLG